MTEKISGQIEERNSETLRVDRIFRTLSMEFDSEVKNVLDIGCWDGTLLEQLPEIWVRHGIELNKYAAEQARKKGLTIFESKIENFVNDVGLHYDIIFMMDVLEHISSPMAVLSRVAQLLVPGGLFIALTGNIETFAARFFGGAWYYVNYPEHVSFFSGESLTKSLQSVDMIPIKVLHVTHHSALVGVTLRKLYRRLLSVNRRGTTGLSNPSFSLNGFALAFSRIVRGKDHLLVLAQKAQ
ncbi:class I SAM-dependent methyltransferase [Methylococcus capsulatus]|uniref:Class I SAM-dependent methyltransferase n=1 Tax=Methylococcus capsulatus TaxID=414 RepID=A0ABZ2F1K3_METCP|nr:class I SAM-dependent methyltransferase [Methylococcus capsulatus]